MSLLTCRITIFTVESSEKLNFENKIKINFPQFDFGFGEMGKASIRPKIKFLVSWSGWFSYQLYTFMIKEKCRENNFMLVSINDGTLIGYPVNIMRGHDTRLEQYLSL